MPNIAKPSKYEMVARLRATMLGAINNNPYQKVAMPTPPTITVTTTSDGTLTVASLASAGVLTSAGANQVAFYGGVPTVISSLYVGLPVASIAPQTGGNFSGSLQSWNGAMETVTDATTIQFGLFTDTNKKIMFQVEDQYTDFTGWSATTASADTYFKLVFATPGVRRIRVMVPTWPATAGAFFKTIRVNALATFWKPAQHDVLKGFFFWDSYGEGTNTSANVYPWPNGAASTLCGELNGIRDLRQCCVGACGIISNDGGLRSTLRQQIPNSYNQGTPNIIYEANGVNDASSAAQVQAEYLLCLQLMRSQWPNTPIISFGCQAGSSGPGANQLAVEAAKAAAVAQFNDPITKFVPVSNDIPAWISGTGHVGATNASGNSDVYIDTDALHPANTTAEAFLAMKMAKGAREAVLSMLN